MCEFLTDVCRIVTGGMTNASLRGNIQPSPFSTLLSRFQVLPLHWHLDPAEK